MSNRTLEAMERRAREVRARSIVRRWQYRQRHLAAGVWFRLRRVLADAEWAFLVDDDDARRLIEEGYVPEPCGAELAPPKTIVFVDDERLASIPSRRPVPVMLGPDLLIHTAIALVPFDRRRVRRADSVPRALTRERRPAPET
jgi:hypothetical protein